MGTCRPPDTTGTLSSQCAWCSGIMGVVVQKPLNGHTGAPPKFGRYQFRRYQIQMLIQGKRSHQSSSLTSLSRFRILKIMSLVASLQLNLANCWLFNQSESGQSELSFTPSWTANFAERKFFLFTGIRLGVHFANGLVSFLHKVGFHYKLCLLLSSLKLEDGNNLLETTGGTLRLGFLALQPLGYVVKFGSY